MSTSQTNLHLGTALYRTDMKMFERQECGANNIMKIEIIEMRVIDCFSFLHLKFLISCETCTFPLTALSEYFYPSHCILVLKVWAYL